MIRHTIERMLRPVSFRRRLSADFNRASLITSAQAGLGHLFKSMDDIDPGLMRVTKQFIQSKHVVWDVGANVGLFTIAAANRVGPNGLVIAFEPDLFLVRLLRQSAAIQPQNAARIMIIPAAVAGQYGFRQFAIAERARANNHLAEYDGSTQSGGVRHYEIVVTIPLDQVPYEAPDVLKIDTEGAEYEVLLGAENIISTKRPLIICEISNRETQPLVCEFLKKYDYQFFDGDQPYPGQSPLQDVAYNTIAIPANHISLRD